MLCRHKWGKKLGSFSKSEPTLFIFLKFDTRKGNGMRHDLLAKLSHLHLPLVALSLFRTFNDNKQVLLSFKNSGWTQGEFIGYHEYILSKRTSFFWKYYYGNINTLWGIYVGTSIDMGLGNGTGSGQVDIERLCRFKKCYFLQYLHKLTCRNHRPSSCLENSRTSFHNAA